MHRRLLLVSILIAVSVLLHACVSLPPKPADSADPLSESELELDIVSLSTSAGDRSSGQVTEVIDGDTIRVLFPDGQQDKVRYIGIDTPETVHPHKPVECYGLEASAYNQALVEGKTVWLRYGVQKRDKYNRLLAYVYLDPMRSTMVNFILIAQGYAKKMEVRSNTRYSRIFSSLEREAMRAGRGLWKECYPMEPIEIYELLPKPSGREPDNEFIKLHNKEDSAVDLSGWILTDGGR